MKRGLLILILMSACSVCSMGRSRVSGDMPRITFGAEWSYSATFFEGHRNYFIAPEGFRVDDRDDRFRYYTNGEVSLHAGYNLDSKWNLSLYLGYASIGRFHPAVPISLRATRFIGSNPLEDRWFTYIDLGSGLSFQTDPKPIVYTKIGGGYRLSLSKYSKIDFLACLRWINTYPEVSYYGEKIPSEDIGRNAAYTASINFGIGITF